jgi:putative Holliday junction resolvase
MPEEPVSLPSASVMTLLAFDYGLRRVGVATGQAITRTATALRTVDSPAAFSNPEEGWRAIDALFKEWRPDALVVGVPYHLDGTEISMTTAAKNFAQALKMRYNKSVYLVDERLTSVEAASEFASERAAGARRRQVKGDLDKISARIILETWFNQ